MMFRRFRARRFCTALGAMLVVGCASVEPPATTDPAAPETVTAEPALSEPTTSDAERATERTAASKAVVLAFYRLLFDERRVAEAFERHVGEVYIQHSPGAPEGRAALETYLGAFLAANSEARFDIKRVIAEDDLVALHVHATTGPDDPGQAVVDIFRVEDGKVVEHWDVVQPVPATTADENTMF